MTSYYDWISKKKDKEFESRNPDADLEKTDVLEKTTVLPPTKKVDLVSTSIIQKIRNLWVDES